MRFERCLAGLLALSVVATPLAARAEAPGGKPASAAAHAVDEKRRGDELLESKRYLEALAAYEAAYALEPNAALLYNRGRALQFLGRYPEALEAIERFATEAPPELRARVPGLAQLRAELHDQVGTVTVTSKVEGARVLLAERQVGVTPLAPLKVSAGRIVVEGFADGYFPVRREIDVAGGATVKVDLALVSRDTSGFVTVRSHVDGARVLLDDKLVGVAPVEAGLLQGTHAVRAQKPGYDDAKTQIVVRAGDRRDVWLDPIASPPLTSRWWFWTAIGVAVAAGAVTVVALSVEKSPSTGDYSPGGVRF